METQDAARVIKETVFGTKSKLLHGLYGPRKLASTPSASKNAERNDMTVCIDVVEKITSLGNVCSRIQSAISANGTANYGLPQKMQESVMTYFGGYLLYVAIFRK